MSTLGLLAARPRLVVRFRGDAVELRSASDGAQSANTGREIGGTAVVYGTAETVRNGRREWRELIRPGAFTMDDVMCLYGHDPNQILGRTGNGSLRLDDDESRLRFELDLPDTTLGRDTYELARRGDIGGASVGMVVHQDDRRGGVREITQATLREISLVGRPAYSTARLG